MDLAFYQLEVPRYFASVLVLLGQTRLIFRSALGGQGVLRKVSIALNRISASLSTYPNMHNIGDALHSSLHSLRYNTDASCCKICHHDRC